MRRIGWRWGLPETPVAAHLICLISWPGFYFDTALSSTAAALPSLLAFDKPDTSSMSSTRRSHRSR